MFKIVNTQMYLTCYKCYIYNLNYKVCKYEF